MGFIYNAFETVKSFEKHIQTSRVERTANRKLKHGARAKQTVIICALLEVCCRFTDAVDAAQ